MAKIPLNFFRRLSVKNLPVTYIDTGTGLNAPLYEAPFERASVIISALATNTTSETQTIYAGLSTKGTPITLASPDLVEFVYNFPIAPFDTVNIVVNKLVLGQYDNLFVKAANPNSINLTLSILETVNTP
jgi:hypothetical protein